MLLSSIYSIQLSIYVMQATLAESSFATNSKCYKYIPNSFLYDCYLLITIYYCFSIIISGTNSVCLCCYILLLLLLSFSNFVVINLFF